ncbi:MAG: M23 family metallopeptidase [Clostridia bacterium]|jgi:murein DD-endopeptidase MepM/ murein hydrolase activator NlpD|nr:M23 family metallopeptidase [Clostridia bacterium]
MRRNVRKRDNQDDELSIKIIKYSGIAVAILAIIVFALLIYSKNLNDEVKDGTLTEEQISSILNNVNSSENTESASSEIGKKVNELSEEMNSNNNINSVNEINTISDNQVKDSQNNVTTQNILTTNKITPTNSEAEKDKRDENKKEEENKNNVELKFDLPVEGEISRDFAKDNLVYSETLQEWTVHTGIDIKADKTTVVKTAETGTVKTIKNDPRYGLTVIIEHANGFQTVYSNLLTSEFVVEGEKVEKGQSLGTVGNTAAFEIADEAHLHFEILKDSVQVDPNIYLK